MNYRPLYSLRIEHDYFDSKVCRAFRCRVPPSATALWHRRALLIRQLAENEWTILYDSAGAGVDTTSDILILEMEITDPAFVLYTRWNAFRPDSTYGLELPAADDTVEAVQAIRETAPKRKIGFGFCQLRIRMTEELFLSAQGGNPMSCTLQFHAPECRWEFLLVPRGESTPAPESLIMEEMGDKLHFLPFESVKAYNREILRTVSEEAVPMRERYDYRLKVSARTGNTERKQLLLKYIYPPEPGKFLDTEPGLLRQICNL
ncbi:MAG: hypothetical protein RR365_15465 [Bacteroides sp.]